MQRQHTYEKIIRCKLNELPALDTTGNWDQLESRLNSEMPQQEKNGSVNHRALNRNMLIAAFVAKTPEQPVTE